MKKYICVLICILTIFIFQVLNQSTVKAKHYYICSGYTENYRGSANSKNNGLTQTVYIDSDNIGRYIDGGKFVKDSEQRGLKGGLFKVRVIEIWDWDVANQYHPKQQIFTKDYYFFRILNNRECSVFDNTEVSYTLTHDMPFEYVMGEKVSGLRCLVPRWVNNGHDVYRNELVKPDKYEEYIYDDWYLLKIYEEARKIYGF